MLFLLNFFPSECRIRNWCQQQRLQWALKLESSSCILRYEFNNYGGSSIYASIVAWSRKTRIYVSALLDRVSKESHFFQIFFWCRSVHSHGQKESSNSSLVFLHSFSQIFVRFDCATLRAAYFICMLRWWSHILLAMNYHEYGRTICIIQVPTR